MEDSGQVVEFSREQRAGPFLETDEENKYIVAGIECFLRLVETYSLPNQQDTTLAEDLVKYWICPFGVSKSQTTRNRPAVIWNSRINEQNS